MGWGAVSTGTFTGTEARAGKVRVRLEAEGAQARWVGIETPWSYLVKVLDEQTWHTLVRARHGDNQEGRHSHCIQSWACRQAGRKPADSQETTAGGERRSRGGWWSVRCQQDGKQRTRSRRGVTGDPFAASHKLLLCFWPEEEPIREKPCCNAAVLPSRDKGKPVATDTSFPSLYAEFLPLDRSFEQRHCLLKANV